MHCRGSRLAAFVATSAWSASGLGDPRHPNRSVGQWPLPNTHAAVDRKTNRTDGRLQESKAPLYPFARHNARCGKRFPGAFRRSPNIAGSAKGSTANLEDCARSKASHARRLPIKTCVASIAAIGCCQQRWQAEGLGVNPRPVQREYRGASPGIRRLADAGHRPGLETAANRRQTSATRRSTKCRFARDIGGRFRLEPPRDGAIRFRFR